MVGFQEIKSKQALNDGLSVPANQYAHQLEFPGLGSGNQPYNQFMAQLPLLNDDFDPFFPVADAVLAFISASCGGESLRVNINICHRGLATLTASTPVVLYDSVTDAAGCQATDALLVRLANKLYFPNAFKPNSPNFDNRVFTGFGGSPGTIIRSLKIFDRWGGFMYDGSDLVPKGIGQGWNGTARGKLVDTGVYIYFATVEFADGETVEYSGDVLVTQQVFVLTNPPG